MVIQNKVEKLERQNRMKKRNRIITATNARK